MAIKHPDYPDIDFKPAIALFDWDQTHDICYFYHKVEVNNDDCPLIDEQIVAIDRFIPDNTAWSENWADDYYELNKHFNYCPYNYVNDDEDYPNFSLSDKFDPQTDYLVNLSEGKWTITYLQREKKAIFIGDYPFLITCYSRHKKIFNIADSQYINLSKFFNQPIRWRIPQYYHVVSNQLTVTGQLPINGTIYDFIGEDIDIDESGNFTFNASDNGVYRIIYCHYELTCKNSYYDTLLITIDQDNITGIPDTNIEITKDNNRYSGNLNIPDLNVIDPNTNQVLVEITKFTVNNVDYLPESIAFFNGCRLQIKSNGSFSFMRDGNKSQALPIIYYIINAYGTAYQGCFIVNINQEFIENSFTPNSLVFTKDNQIQQPSFSDKFFLYDDISSYFNTVKTELENYLNNKNNYPENEHIELGKFAKEYKQHFIDINTSDDLEITYESFPESMRGHCALIRANNDKWNKQTGLSNLGVNIPSFSLTTILNQDFTQFNDINTWFLGSAWATLYALSKNKTFNQILSNSSFGYTENLLFNFHENHPWRGFSSNPQSYLLNKSSYIPVFPRLYEGNLYLKKPNVFNFVIFFGWQRRQARVLDKWEREVVINLGCKKIIYHFIDTYITNNDGDNYTLYSGNEGEIIKSEYTFKFDLKDDSYISNSAEGFANGFDLKLEYEWFTDQEFKDLFTYFQNNYLVSEEFALNWTKENVIMPDSIAIKEIHACLGAAEFAYIQKDPPVPAYMNIARRLDYVAKALGINFDLNGEIIPVRQSKHLNRGDTIPAGWYLGQFGRNEGGNTNLSAQQGGFPDEERLGIVYEVKGNRFEQNQASGDEEITQGGYILCESLTQLWHIMLQDLDRSLGLQTLGSIAIANPNYNPDYSGNNEDIKTAYWKYNGLGQLILDLMYLSGDTNRHAAQANVGSLKAQAVAGEILAALGVPAQEKVITMRVDDELKFLKYPAFNSGGMTIADLLFWALQNLAIQNEGA